MLTGSTKRTEDASILIYDYKHRTPPKRGLNRKLLDKDQLLLEAANWIEEGGFKGNRPCPRRPSRLYRDWRKPVERPGAFWEDEHRQRFLASLHATITSYLSE